MIQINSVQVLFNSTKQCDTNSHKQMKYSVLCCREVKEKNQHQSVNPEQAGEVTPNPQTQVRVLISPRLSLSQK